MVEDGQSQPGRTAEGGFAPDDLTDNRGRGDWRSRYEPDAWKHIWKEAGYLFFILIADVLLMLCVWLRYPQRALHLSEPANFTFSRFGLAWLSGTLGGTLFGMKWLYHSVAKEMWHLDRQLWRYLIPHISGGLAFGVIAIIQSLGVFDPDLVSSCARTSALGFLAGFFSDNALAKLAEVAENLLGPARRTAPFFRKSSNTRDSTKNN